jgi:hypothetical protein
MVTNIVPVGNGQTEEPGRRYAIVFYVLGSISGGIVLGYVLTSIGAVLRRAYFFHEYGRYVSLLVGVLFLLASAREVEILKFRLPQSRSQVPRSWFYTLGHYAGAFAWGGYLGLGFLTSVVSISFYAIVLWIVLMGGREVGLMLTLAYEVGRVMPVISVRWMSSKIGHDIYWYARVIGPFSSVVLVLNGILLVGLGSLLLTASSYH